MWKFKCAIPLLGYFKSTKIREVFKTTADIGPKQILLLFIIFNQSK